MATGYIYKLSCIGGPVRYIGQSTNPQLRFASLTDFRKPSSCGPLLRAWLYRNVGKVRLEVIEPTNDMDTRERYWISRYRDAGMPLLNIQDGGKEKMNDCSANLAKMQAMLGSWNGADPEDVAVLKELIRQSEATQRNMKIRSRRRRRLLRI